MKTSYRHFVACVILAVASGCTPDGPQTYEVHGQIKLDGVPLDEGEIVFRSTDGADRSYASRFQKGAYSLRSTAGQKQVAISALKKFPGKGVPGSPGDPIGPDNPADLFLEMVPIRYNKKTTLTVEVTPAGSNEFDFDLATKPK